YYGVTSYAGNHGTMNYFVTTAGGCGPASTDDGLFFLYTSPGSTTAGSCYVRPAPLACERHDHPLKLKQVTDGTSKTLMFGEKYNEDATVDAKFSDTSGLLIHEWSLWGFTGGQKITGHVARSGGYTQAINRQSTNCTLSAMCCQDERLRTWGSGHPGG